MTNDSLCSEVATLKQVLYDLRAQRDVEVAAFIASIEQLRRDVDAMQQRQQKAWSDKQWTDFAG